jgi:two-component system alkaline phosphatase synthesis response regulator PhoP
MATILLVDDEAPIRDLLRAYLVREGYTIIEAADGYAALKAHETHQIDVILLDLMIPGIDGIEVCRRIRANSDVYIIMVTARADEVDRVVGLEVGADDYLIKPFSPREMVARVRACLRRPRVATYANPKILQFDELTIDFEGHIVRIENEPVALTTTEYLLVTMLATAPGRMYSRAQLLAHIWGASYYGDDHVVDVHIANARRKLKDDPTNPRFIETVRGAGYRWRTT